MASKKDVQDNLDFLSDRISAQVRTIALSVIAIAWLFLVGGKEAPVLPVPPNRTLLLWAGAFSLGALLADYFQYFMGYLDGRRVLARGEREGVEQFKYDYGATTWKLRTVFFWAKQGLGMAGVVALAMAISTALLAHV